MGGTEEVRRVLDVELNHRDHGSGNTTVGASVTAATGSSWGASDRVGNTISTGTTSLTRA